MTHIPTTCTTFAFRGCQLFGNAETAETPIFAFQTALTNITNIHTIPHNHMVHSWSFLVILLHMLVFETISLDSFGVSDLTPTVKRPSVHVIWPHHIYSF
jgi:hypothetical protein